MALNGDSYLQEIYNGIAKSAEPTTALRKVVENFDRRELQAIFSDEDPSSFERSLALARRNTEALIAYLEPQILDVDEFYDKLWRNVERSPLFEDENMRPVALLALLTSPSLPYERIEEFDMKWDEFSMRRAELQDEIDRLNRALAREYRNVGVASAALLDIVTSPSDRKDQVVLMTELLSTVSYDDVKDVGDEDM